jgi:hypothetical protein
MVSTAPQIPCCSKLTFLSLGSDCSTGLLYNTLGDPSPISIYGCFDAFKLYRTVDAAATSGRVYVSKSKDA